jgi:hypothetical protein
MYFEIFDFFGEISKNFGLVKLKAIFNLFLFIEF